MKKYITLIIVILILSLIASSFIYKTSAVGLGTLGEPEDYIKEEEDSRGAINIADVIVWGARTIGEAVAVVMLLALGIKYILGSVEEKAEYKQSMYPYIIGAILIFAGAAVTDIIYKAFNGG